MGLYTNSEKKTGICGWTEEVISRISIGHAKAEAENILKNHIKDYHSKRKLNFCPCCGEDLRGLK